MRLCLCIDAVMRGVLPAYMRVIFSHSVTSFTSRLPPPPSSPCQIMTTISYLRIALLAYFRFSFFFLIPLRDDSRDRNGSSKLEEIRSRGWSKGKLLP